MDSLKSKWTAANNAVKIAVGIAAALITVVFVLKVLPYLVAALGLGALLAILFIPYWLPSILAFVRHHPSKGGILVINFVFGWTFIGWVVSLVWALSDNTGRAQSVVVHTTVSPTFSVNSEVPASHVASYQGADGIDLRRFDREPPPAPGATPASLPPGD